MSQKQYRPDQLVFVGWSYADPLKGITSREQHHLAQYRDGGLITTACRMVVMPSAKQPDFSSTSEPAVTSLCSVCSSRSGDFLKRFPGKKPKLRLSAKSKASEKYASDEEAYRVDYDAVDELHFV